MSHSKPFHSVIAQGLDAHLNSKTSLSINRIACLEETTRHLATLKLVVNQLQMNDCPIELCIGLRHLNEFLYELSHVYTGKAVPPAPLTPPKQKKRKSNVVALRGRNEA